MDNIKRILTERIVEPTADSRSSATIMGEVIESNEISNTCDVIYTDKKGKQDKRNGVSVFSYNKSVIDWFPKKNDKVLLQENNGVIYITGPAESNHSNTRSQIKLENDIYSDSFVSGIGGFVF